MQEQSHWLVPLLSILVIFQAVVMITQPRTTGKREAYIPPPEIEKAKEASSKLTFVPAGVSLHKGETVNIDLFFSPKRSLRIDGIDVVLTFDPQILQVTQVVTPKLFSFVSQNKELEKNDRLYLTFLEEKPEGLLVDKEIKLLTLSVKGKALGEGKVAILTAEEGPTTVIVENGTSKKISFDKGSLKVVVY